MCHCGVKNVKNFNIRKQNFLTFSSFLKPDQPTIFFSLLIRIAQTLRRRLKKNLAKNNFQHDGHFHYSTLCSMGARSKMSPECSFHRTNRYANEFICTRLWYALVLMNWKPICDLLNGLIESAGFRKWYQKRDLSQCFQLHVYFSFSMLKYTWNHPNKQ